MLRPFGVKVKQHDVPGRLVKHILRQVGQSRGALRGTFGEFTPSSVGVEEYCTALVQNIAVVCEQLVVLPGLRVDLQQLSLGDALAVLDETLRAVAGDTAVRFRLRSELLAVAAGGDDVVVEGDKEDA